MFWKYFHNDRIGGPVATEGLIAMINRGQLASEDMVFHSILGRWTPVREVRNRLIGPSYSQPRTTAQPAVTKTGKPPNVAGRRPLQAAAQGQRPAPANPDALPVRYDPWLSPNILVGGVIGGGVLALLLAVLFFCMRGNDWEQQQKSQLLALGAQAKTLLYQNQYAEAAAQYETMFELVAGREITDPGLAQIMKSAAQELEQARKGMKKPKPPAYVPPAPASLPPAPTPIPPAPVIALTPTPVVLPAPVAAPTAIPTATPAPASTPIAAAVNPPAPMPVPPDPTVWYFHLAFYSGETLAHDVLKQTQSVAPAAKQKEVRLEPVADGKNPGNLSYFVMLNGAQNQAQGCRKLTKITVDPGEGKVILSDTGSLSLLKAPVILEIKDGAGSLLAVVRLDRPDRNHRLAARQEIKIREQSAAEKANNLDRAIKADEDKNANPPKPYKCPACEGKGFIRKPYWNISGTIPNIWGGTTYSAGYHDIPCTNPRCQGGVIYPDPAELTRQSNLRQINIEHLKTDLEQAGQAVAAAREAAEKLPCQVQIPVSCFALEDEWEDTVTKQREIKKRLDEARKTLQVMQFRSANSRLADKDDLVKVQGAVQAMQGEFDQVSVRLDELRAKLNLNNK